MSVGTILNATGKIPINYLDLDGATGFVTNPLTSDLQCTNTGSNYNLVDAGYVSATSVYTDNLSNVPGALVPGIAVADSLRIADTKAVRFDQNASVTALGSNRIVAQTSQVGTLDEDYTYANGAMVYTPFTGTLQVNDPAAVIPVGAGLSVHGTIKADGIPTFAALPNVLGYDPATGDIQYQPAGGGGGVTNPMSADLSSGNYNIDMEEGRMIFGHFTTTPSTYSINGVYNIDSGTLPYPVLRFSSSKAGGTQQKSLTLEMNDGRAIWSSQWEGSIPQEIETKQNVYYISGQGAGARTELNCDVVNITPNFASASAVNVTGNVNVAIPPTVGNNLTNKTYVDGRTQRPTNVYYVSKNGSDSTGDGSIGKPYLTIQQAITTAETGALPSVANPATILIGPGNYTENLTMTDGYTTLIANTTNNRTYSTKILGTITINASGANDLFNRNFGFQGLLVRATGANPALIDSTVATEHSVVANNCRFIADDRAFYQNFSGNSRNIFLNCAFFHENPSALYTNPLVEMAGLSWLEAIQCEFSSQNPQCDVLTFSGNSFPYRIGQCLLTSGSVSASANPIVRYATTNTNAGAFGYCAFVYESSTNKAANNPPAGTATATAILFDTAGRVYASAALLLTYNQFVLNGLASTALNCIGKSAATLGTPIIASGTSIAAPTLASKIQGGGAITHLTFNTVS